MGFCANCGAQLEGDSRFCVQCGADQKAKAGGAPVAAAPDAAGPPAAASPAAVPPAAFPPAAVPPAAIPPHPVQPFAGIPPQYPPPPPAQPFAGVPPQFPAPPGQIPVIMGAPPVAPPANKNTLLYVIIAAAVLYGFYYIGTHDQNQNPGTTPAPQTQPGQQPGGQGNPNQAIIQAQKFDGNYNAVNGQIQVTQGTWLNGSNVPLAAARLGCEQMTSTGQGLTQDQVTLTGPAQPGQTITLQTFSIGAEAQGAAKVKCVITDVETVN